MDWKPASVGCSPSLKTVVSRGSSSLPQCDTSTCLGAAGQQELGALLVLRTLRHFRKRLVFSLPPAWEGQTVGQPTPPTSGCRCAAMCSVAACSVLPLPSTVGRGASTTTRDCGCAAASHASSMSSRAAASAGSLLLMPMSSTTTWRSVQRRGGGLNAARQGHLAAHACHGHGWARQSAPTMRCSASYSPPWGQGTVAAAPT